MLFYYTGHLLESTVINLELYFEHRNYLSAAFLFLPLAALLYDKASPGVFITTTILIALLLGGFLRYSSTVWSSFPSLVETSARKAPTSARAQAQFATQLHAAGRAEEALEVIDRAIDVIPGDAPHLLLNRLVILCEQNLLDRDEYERVAGVLSGKRYDPRLIRVYSAFIAAVIAERCPSVPIETLRPMFAGMLEIPHNSDATSLGYSHIQYLIGYTDAFSGDAASAFAAFEKSLEARPGASHAMMMAALMATNGYYDEALTLSDVALTQLDADSQSTIRGARVSAADIREFQSVVRADKEAEQDAGTSRPEP